ncbi:MAG: hypothetical protein L3K23_08555 [Thermoplasmata archaeon]|nr:hypothetical protein [Thermoplasmata archaeon]
MSEFLLSPGITPELTDLFAVELPLAIAAGFLLGRARGFGWAFGLNALALGAIKFITDYRDPGDDIVAAAAVIAGLVFLGQAVAPQLLARLPKLALVVGGLLLIVIGAIKIRADFYDPFDLLLADTAAAGGLAAWVASRTPPATVAPPSAGVA